MQNSPKMTDNQLTEVESTDKRVSVTEELSLDVLDTLSGAGSERLDDVKKESEVSRRKPRG